MLGRKGMQIKAQIELEREGWLSWKQPQPSASDLAKHESKKEKGHHVRDATV
jgi:ribosomal protein L11